MVTKNTTHHLKNQNRLPQTPNSNVINNVLTTSSYGDYKYELKQNDVPSGLSCSSGMAYFFIHTDGGQSDPLNVVIQVFDNITKRIINTIETNRIPYKNGLFDFTQPQDKGYTYFCFFKTSVENPITYDIHFTSIENPILENLTCNKVKLIWSDVPAEVKGDSTQTITNLGSIQNLVIDGQFNSTKLNLFQLDYPDDINSTYSWRENQIRNLKTYLTPNVVYTCEYTGATQANNVLQDEISVMNFDNYDDEYRLIASSPQKYLNINSPIGNPQYRLNFKYIAINLNGLYCLRPNKTVTLSFYLKQNSPQSAEPLNFSFEFAELGKMNNSAGYTLVDSGLLTDATINLNDYQTWKKVNITLQRPDSIMSFNRSINKGALDFDVSITQIKIMLPLDLVEYNFSITNLMLSYGENDIDFIRSENDVVRGLLNNPEILNMVNYGITAKSSTLGQVSCNAFDDTDKETSILADGRLIQKNDVYEFYNYDALGYIDEDKPINYIPYQPLFDLLVNRYQACDGGSDDFVTAYSLYDKNIYPSYITDDDITTMDVSLLIAKNKTEFSKDWFQVSNASKGISIVELSRGCNLPAGQGLDIKVYGIQGKMDTFIYQANMDNYRDYIFSLPNFNNSFFSPSAENDYSISTGVAGISTFDIAYTGTALDPISCITKSKNSLMHINSDYLTNFRFDILGENYGKIKPANIKSLDCEILNKENVSTTSPKKGMPQTFALFTFKYLLNYDLSITGSTYERNQTMLIPNQIHINAIKIDTLPDSQSYSITLNNTSTIYKNKILDNTKSNFTWNYTQDKYNPISDTNPAAKKVLMPFAVSQVALFGIKFTGGITPTNYKGAWFSFQTSRKKTIKVKQIQENLTKLQSQILNANNFAVWLDTTGGDSKPSDLPSNYIPLRVDISTIKKVGDIENLIMNAINYYEIKILDYSDRILIGGKNNNLEIQTKLFNSHGYKANKNLSYEIQISQTGRLASRIILNELRGENSNFYNTANVNWHLSLI